MKCTRIKSMSVRRPARISHLDEIGFLNSPTGIVWTRFHNRKTGSCLCRVIGNGERGRINIVCRSRIIRIMLMPLMPRHISGGCRRSCICGGRCGICGGRCCGRCGICGICGGRCSGWCIVLCGWFFYFLVTASCRQQHGTR